MTVCRPLPVPICAQIEPTRIVSLYQRFLLHTGPLLELLFACDGIFDVNELLDVDEKHLVVLLGVPISLLGPMLPHTALKIRSDADVSLSGGLAIM